MKENKEKILGLLAAEEPHRTVISVVGNEGPGKTTLVTRIYNNQIIKRCSDCWPWISVSQTYGMDDVWSIELWSRTRGAFPNNRNGSKIILTTRHENVAVSIGIGSHVHRLYPLQEKDDWVLFCRKAFWNDPELTCPKELQPWAEAILRKYEGLPLAIVAVESLMCSRSKGVAT
ncbi:conserved hypothetical protein [Ricinus communis]|uniref:NB-ARC domain-containing protein n=1 Tax=Ricinus communis TaxID=3988 RepID=B9T1T2_RICCO|nr:conserved hypothetical protein [Ricinus communis]